MTFVTLLLKRKDNDMADEIKLRMARAVLIKLLEFATGGAIRLMWADWTTGRVLLKVNPGSEQVQEILTAMARAQ